MNHFLQKQVLWFFSDYRFKIATSWFKNLSYLILILKCITWLISYQYYFGDHAVVFTRQMTVSSVKDLAFLLYASQSSVTSCLFIIGLLVLSLLKLIFKKPYFFADVIIWFLLINLNNKIYPTLTGGDYLLNQFLLFNCFLCSPFMRGENWWADLKIFFHNLAVTATMIQVCLLYFLSGLAKCNDPGWMSGNAVIDLLPIAHFNLFVMKEIPSGASLDFFSFLSYVVIFYQLTFPLLVWFKKIKKPLIVIGLVMHLYIAIVMGLFEFGLVMMLSYIYFWPFKTGESDSWKWR